ncbi:MAG: peptidoglycan DD-metalloendopeptidase family protein [Lachnospiraceae bacterium]|nr:peptidoglycan DD-metalloendopeptidase family protein [Lachnospiraceae bacterium]
MSKNKHKRKVSRIIIFTTDAVDAKMKQIKIHPWFTAVLTVVICCLLGAGIGYAVYETQIWQREKEKDAEVAASMEGLEAEIARLEGELAAMDAQIVSRDEKIEALSSAFNAQADAMASLQGELTEQSLPNDYPLTGSAGIEEYTEGDPIVIFSATEGITAVASAKGTVTAVEEDETYGHRIVVDHGNGYVSVYLNKGDVQVSVGDEVAKGTTLFLIGEDNKQLGYQIMKDGSYINPMDMLSING